MASGESRHFFIRSLPNFSKGKISRLREEMDLQILGISSRTGSKSLLKYKYTVRNSIFEFAETPYRSSALCAFYKSALHAHSNSIITHSRLVHCKVLTIGCWLSASPIIFLVSGQYSTSKCSRTLASSVKWHVTAPSAHECSALIAMWPSRAQVNVKLWK